MNSDSPPIVSRAQLLADIPGLKPATLDYLLRNRHENGLAEAGAVFRPGREFLFDPVRFVGYIRDRKAA